jgi:nicotinate-nucleotide--dimethylbenzimidazole phosphoribosyltransferase
MKGTLDASLAEICALVEGLAPWGNERAATGAPADGSLGLLDSLAAWMGAGQGMLPPRLDRPRAAIFLGRWGGSDAEAAAALDALRMGPARLRALCGTYDAELRIYEMAVEAPDALTGRQCAAAMAYGMTAVEDGIDLLCLAAAGPGLPQAAAALSQALPADAAPLASLARYGGHALAALAGAVIAARVGRIPVILDGFGALAAAAVLQSLNASALDHCVLAHQASGTAFGALQERLGKAAVLDLGIVAEDGSAALLVLGLLRGALASPDGHSPS